MDNSRRHRAFFIHSVTFLVTLAATSYLVWALRPLILPVVLGILMAYLFRPLKTAFKYHWLPDGVRVAILFLLFTSSLLFGIKIVKDNIPNEKEKLEFLVRTKYKFNEKFNKIMEIDPATGKGNAFYNIMSQDINPLVASIDNALELTSDQKDAFIGYYRGTVLDDANAEKYFQYFLANNNETKMSMAAALKAMGPPKETQAAASAASGSTGGAVPVKPGDEKQSLLKQALDIVSIWFVLPVVFVFFLFDDGSIDQFFIKLVPNRYFELALTVQEEVDDAIGKYLRGVSLECALVGLSMAVGLFFIGVSLKMSILIGVLSGVATAIPFLGPVLGVTLGLVYALITEDIHPLLPFMNLDNLAIGVIVVNIVVLLLDNFVFQPIVLGGAVNLHPLVIILGLVAGSMMFGAAGTLLAIPVIVTLKVVVQHTFRGLKDYRII